MNQVVVWVFLDDFDEQRVEIASGHEISIIILGSQQVEQDFLRSLRGKLSFPELHQLLVFQALLLLAEEDPAKGRNFQDGQKKVVELLRTEGFLGKQSGNCLFFFIESLPEVAGEDNEVQLRNHTGIDGPAHFSRNDRHLRVLLLNPGRVVPARIHNGLRFVGRLLFGGLLHGQKRSGGARGLLQRDFVLKGEKRGGNGETLENQSSKLLQLFLVSLVGDEVDVELIDLFLTDDVLGAGEDFVVDLLFLQHCDFLLLIKDLFKSL